VSQKRARSLSVKSSSMSGRRGRPREGRGAGARLPFCELRSRPTRRIRGLKWSRAHVDARVHERAPLVSGVALAAPPDARARRRAHVDGAQLAVPRRVPFARCRDASRAVTSRTLRAARTPRTPHAVALEPVAQYARPFVRRFARATPPHDSRRTQSQRGGRQCGVQRRMELALRSAANRASVAASERGLSRDHGRTLANRTGACDSCAGCRPHCHHKRRCDPAATSDASWSPSRVGCHSSATHGNFASNDVSAPTLLRARTGQPVEMRVRWEIDASHSRRGSSAHFHHTRRELAGRNSVGRSSPFRSTCQSRGIAGNTAARLSAGITPLRLHIGQPVFLRLATVACHSWSVKCGPYHQTLFWEPAVTSPGPRSPLRVGCHSRASARFIRRRDVAGITIRQAQIGQPRPRYVRSETRPCQRWTDHARSATTL